MTRPQMKPQMKSQMLFSYGPRQVGHAQKEQSQSEEPQRETCSGQVPLEGLEGS